MIKEGFFERIKGNFLRKENLGFKLTNFFRGKKISDNLFEELEEHLLIADVSVYTANKIINNMIKKANIKQLKNAEVLYNLLKEEVCNILRRVEIPLNIREKMPFIILMVGVNGSGKTTTIGKLTNQFVQQGKSVMLAAGDTFRAMAIEQLQIWGQRNNVPVIKQHIGADPASVIFDAIQAAKARNINILLADTAGRLQNKSYLMKELQKIVMVMKKIDENAPDEVMITIDVNTGQNAIMQAMSFNEAIKLNGIILTKLDGTAKGGSIISIADQLCIPVRYIGFGEHLEDLDSFNANNFIETLFPRSF